jgi:hypothetical protein
MRYPIARILGVTIVVLSVSPVLAAVGDATGTWTWTMERNGQTITTTLKLKQDDTKLTGTISGRNNSETPIEDAKIEGDTISFRVTREFNGNRMVIKYRGTLSGDTIKGKSEVERDGETRERDWEAKRGS